MKNKIIKFLTVVTVISFALFTLIACNGSGGTEPSTPPEHVCEYGAWTSNGDGTHTRVCVENSTHSQTEDCSGGTATCTEKAKCEVCATEYGELKAHEYDNLKYNSTTHWYECECGAQSGLETHKGGQATCKAIAICAVCGTSYGALSNHVYESGVCKWCGAEPQYTRNGNLIYFGSYPQTEVTDGTTTSALLSTAGNSINSTIGWTSYNYYVSGVQTDCMYYKDVEYSGEKYRGVYIKNYRPWNATSSSSADYTYQDDNGHTTNSVYWFKYEPIEWTIVSEEGGYATIVCNMILDSQAYQDTYTSSNGDYYNNNTGTPSGTYANNYKYSTIRKWLNETFYETAFSTLQQSIIQTVEVDNSAESTGYTNEYACENTNDKVWLLSYKEAATYFTTNASRYRKPTDYAQSQGAFTSTSGSYLGNDYWWLRSPSIDTSGGAWYVMNDGNIDSIYHLNVSSTIYGVVPALQIQL